MDERRTTMTAAPEPSKDAEFQPFFRRTPSQIEDVADDRSGRPTPAALFTPCLPHDVDKFRAIAMTCAPQMVAEPGGHAAVAGTKLREQELETVREEADRILQAARDTAQETLAAANDESARMVEQSRKTTELAVRAEQEAAFTAEIARFRECFAEAQEHALRTLAEEVTSLVADIAEKVIYRAIDADPEATLRAIKRALEELPGGGTIQITVPRDEEGLVSEHRQTLLSVLREASDIRIVPDDKLERGGCVVQSNRGEVDARLETRLAAMREEIERAA